MWSDLPKDVCLKAEYKEMLTNAVAEVRLECTQTKASTHTRTQTHTHTDAHTERYTLKKKNKKNKKHTHWIWEGQEVFFADEKFTFLLTDKATVLFTWTLHWLIYIPSQYILTTQYLLSESDYFQHSCQ